MLVNVLYVICNKYCYKHAVKNEKKGNLPIKTGIYIVYLSGTSQFSLIMLNDLLYWVYEYDNFVYCVLFDFWGNE